MSDAFQRREGKPRRRGPRWPILATAAALSLAGCMAPGGGFDAEEGCRPQLTSFNAAGDAFLGNARRDPSGLLPLGAVPTNFGRSADTLDAELRRENAELDALQIAFDALLYCRWIEARLVRAELAAGRIARPVAESRMAALRSRLERDLTRAQAVLDSLEQRASAREAALEAAAPGTREATRRARAETGATRRVVAAATVPLRLRPEAAAPEIGRVPAGQAVTVRPAQSGFALVEGQGGLRGYAPTGAFQIAERTAPAVAGGGPLRQLAATNIARRDNFAESLGLAREAAVSGFELAS